MSFPALSGAEPPTKQEMAKQVVLNGASSGIGLELLKQLLAQGHRVAVIARTEAQSDELQNNFRILSGVKIVMNY